jgi:hypothetical protein
MSTGDPDTAEQTKRALGWTVWVIVALAIVSAVAGLLLLGPFGIAVAIPVAIALFVLFGASSGGPTTGA